MVRRQCLLPRDLCRKPYQWTNVRILLGSGSHPATVSCCKGSPKPGAAETRHVCWNSIRTPSLPAPAIMYRCKSVSRRCKLTQGIATISLIYASPCVAEVSCTCVTTQCTQIWYQVGVHIPRSSIGWSTLDDFQDIVYAHVYGKTHRNEDEVLCKRHFVSPRRTVWSIIIQVCWDRMPVTYTVAEWSLSHIGIDLINHSLFAGIRLTVDDRSVVSRA